MVSAWSCSRAPAGVPHFRRGPCPPRLQKRTSPSRTLTCPPASAWSSPGSSWAGARGPHLSLSSRAPHAPQAPLPCPGLVGSRPCPAHGPTVYTASRTVFPDRKAPCGVSLQRKKTTLGWLFPRVSPQERPVSVTRLSARGPPRPAGSWRWGRRWPRGQALCGPVGHSFCGPGRLFPRRGSPAHTGAWKLPFLPSC